MFALVVADSMHAFIDRVIREGRDRYERGRGRARRAAGATGTAGELDPLDPSLGAGMGVVAPVEDIPIPIEDYTEDYPGDGGVVEDDGFELVGHPSVGTGGVAHARARRVPGRDVSGDASGDASGGARGSMAGMHVHPRRAPRRPPPGGGWGGVYDGFLEVFRGAPQEVEVGAGAGSEAAAARAPPVRCGSPRKLARGVLDDMFPATLYSPTSGIHNTSCPICLEAFEEGVPGALVRNWKCGHALCDACALMYIKRTFPTPRCPVCRQ